MTTRKFWLAKGLKFAFFAVVFIAFFGFATMTLWNWLMPELFGLTTITIWQAFGILFLSKMLFGNFGPGGGRGKKWGGHWKHRMKEKWHNMTPEEREAFKKKMKAEWKEGKHCGPYGLKADEDETEGTVNPREEENNS